MKYRLASLAAHMVSGFCVMVSVHICHVLVYGERMLCKKQFHTEIFQA